MIQPFVENLKKDAKENELFRKVVFTGAHSQLVLMSLQPGEEIGAEVHEVDQLIYIVSGEGKTVLDGSDRQIEKGTVLCVPAGVKHNVVNTDAKPMKLFTVYAPAAHRPGEIDRTKADAEAAEPALAEAHRA